MNKYVKYIVGLLLLITGVFFFRAQEGRVLNEEDYQYPMQVISADMKHERTISWQAPNEKKSGIEIRKKGEEKFTFFQAESRELPSFQNTPKRIYVVKLRELTPDTEYEYRIGIEDGRSTWYSFRTESEKDTSFKVLIFGDSQSADYNVWKNTAQIAWQSHPDASFFINMGDLVDNGQDDFQWNAWRNGAADLLKSIPVAPIMGNHEDYSLDWQMAKPDIYQALFSLPDNGPDDYLGHSYSYDYGDVHFTVLDTQLNELKGWYPDLYEKQAQWLKEDLARTQKRWKVVLMHRTMWRYPFNGPMDETGRAFSPILNEYQVDLVFNAHVHSYSRTLPLKNGIPAFEGTVFITTGRSGDRAWAGSPQKPMDEAFYNPVDMPNYLVFEGSSEVLKISSFKQDGTLIDETELRK